MRATIRVTAARRVGMMRALESTGYWWSWMAGVVLGLQSSPTIHALAHWSGEMPSVDRRCIDPF